VFHPQQSPLLFLVGVGPGDKSGGFFSGPLQCLVPETLDFLVVIRLETLGGKASRLASLAFFAHAVVALQYLVLPIEVLQLLVCGCKTPLFRLR
jgi:hypothetical protein